MNNNKASGNNISIGHILRKTYKIIFLLSCLLAFVPAALYLSQHIYFHFTHPSWGELNALITTENIIILGSKHYKRDSYYAEFEIYIPKEKDRQKFISMIEHIGKLSLIDKKTNSSGETEYYFPINTYWIHVVGKDGRYSITKAHIFTPHESQNTL